jgi:hypothetical protein
MEIIMNLYYYKRLIKLIIFILFLNFYYFNYLFSQEIPYSRKNLSVRSDGLKTSKNPADTNISYYLNLNSMFGSDMKNEIWFLNQNGNISYSQAGMGSNESANWNYQVNSGVYISRIQSFKVSLQGSFTGNQYTSLWRTEKREEGVNASYGTGVGIDSKWDLAKYERSKNVLDIISTRGLLKSGIPEYISQQIQEILGTSEDVNIRIANLKMLLGDIGLLNQEPDGETIQKIGEMLSSSSDSRLYGWDISLRYSRDISKSFSHDPLSSYTDLSVKYYRPLSKNIEFSSGISHKLNITGSAGGYSLSLFSEIKGGGFQENFKIGYNAELLNPKDMKSTFTNKLNVRYEHLLIEQFNYTLETNWIGKNINGLFYVGYDLSFGFGMTIFR